MKHFPVCIPVTKSAFKNFNLKIEMVMYKAHKDKSLGIDKRQMGVMLFHLKVSEVVRFRYFNVPKIANQMKVL